MDWVDARFPCYFSRASVIVFWTALLIITTSHSHNQLKNLLLIFSKRNGYLLLEKSHHVSSTNWWSGFMEWLLQFQENHSIEIQGRFTDLNGIEPVELFKNLPPEPRIALSVSEVWWTDWFLEEFPGEIWAEIWAKLRVANHTH